MKKTFSLITFSLILVSLCLVSCDKLSGEISPNCPLYVDPNVDFQSYYYTSPYSCQYDPTKKIKMKGRTTLGYYNLYRYGYDPVSKKALFEISIKGISCAGVFKEAYGFVFTVNNFELNQDNVLNLKDAVIQSYSVRTNTEILDFVPYKTSQNVVNTFTIHKFNPDTKYLEASLNITLENEKNPQDIIKLEASHFQMGYCDKTPPGQNLGQNKL